MQDGGERSRKTQRLVNLSSLLQLEQTSAAAVEARQPDFVRRFTIAWTGWLKMLCGPLQPVVIAQVVPAYSVAEQAALAQDRHDVLGEQVEPAGQPGRHHVEAIGGAILEPGLDIVGDLSGGAGDHPLAARTGEALHELTDGRLLAIDDVDHELEAAGHAARAAGVDQMARERAIQVEAGEVEADHLAKLRQRVFRLDQIVELVLQAVGFDLRAGR